MGGKSDPPPAPDYTSAANATAAGNLEAAKFATKANRVNQYTPYGSLTYSQNPDETWNQYVNLSPTGQSLLDQSNRTSMGLAALQDQATAKVRDQQIRGWNDGSLPNMESVYDPNRATNEATNLLNARLIPQQQRDMASLQTQLVNQGIAPGSQAWKNAMDDLGRTQNDARNQAALQGITLGQQQQAQRYAQALSGRQQGIQEQNYFNTRDLNNLNALRTGSQVTNPTFTAVPQQATTAGPDLLGAAQGQYNAQLGAYNAQQAGQSGFMGGLMGLGGAMLGGPTGSAGAQLMAKILS